MFKLHLEVTFTVIGFLTGGMIPGWDVSILTEWNTGAAELGAC